MKKLISWALVCILAVTLLGQVNRLVIPKSGNRYYILQQYLRENPEQNLHDVQIFGSCHAYTSFDPRYLERETGISSFVHANPGEIIPTTYLWMQEQFRRHTPKVAVVEIWGINAYDTCSATEEILGDYLPKNMEQVPFSLEKAEVIRDFDTLDPLGMHLPLVTYKQRLVDGTLNENDWNYTFDKVKKYTNSWISEEMTDRLANNGYRSYKTDALPDYPEKQAVVSGEETLPIEENIEKYIYKIIELCREKGVTLIFYRAPYVSKETELRKSHYMQQLCDGEGVTYIDLEQAVAYDPLTDFCDYEHLSQTGADKTTAYLTPYILQGMETN